MSVRSDILQNITTMHIRISNSNHLYVIDDLIKRYDTPNLQTKTVKEDQNPSQGGGVGRSNIYKGVFTPYSYCSLGAPCVMLRSLTVQIVCTSKLRTYAYA